MMQARAACAEPVAVTIRPASEWQSMFAISRTRIVPSLGPGARLHHIGSTAVAGLLAKPILDLMAETADLASVDSAALIGMGFEAMGAFGIDGRLYFRQIVGGVRRQHLHIYAAGSPHLARHLAFRDYLAAHPAARAAYAAVKADLVARPGQTWEGYCAGKDAVVAELERAALAWAGDR